MNAIDAEIVLRAHADAISLPAVLQLAELEGLTGTVAVGEVGRVEMIDGVPVAASCPPWTGVDALCDLFLADATEIVAHRSGIPAAPPLGHPSGLVLEGARRMDDWARLAGTIVAPEDHSSEVSERLHRVRDAADGELAVFELAVLLDEPRGWTAHAVAALLDLGALRVVGTKPVVDDEPTPAAPVAPAVDDSLTVFELLDRGRDALRRGQLDVAHATFAAAVAKDPDHRIATQNLRRVARLMEQAE